MDWAYILKLIIIRIILLDCCMVVLMQQPLGSTKTVLPHPAIDEDGGGRYDVSGHHALCELSLGRLTCQLAQLRLQTLLTLL